MDDKYTQKKSTLYQRNANQNYIEIQSHYSQNGNHQEKRKYVGESVGQGVWNRGGNPALM
jgi:hypothetical protein